MAIFEHALGSNRTSFSGSDVRAVIYLPNYEHERFTSPSTEANQSHANAGGIVHELGVIQTLSVSSFREKHAVRSLGFQNAVGYTRGNRTIAGHLIFSLVNQHPFVDKNGRRGGILEQVSGGIGSPQSFSHPDDDDEDDVLAHQINRRHQYDFTWDSQTFGHLMHPDELPPFDIIVTFANEAGNIGRIILHGVDLHEQGMTLSIEDLFTEVVYKYTARGYSEFRGSEGNLELQTEGNSDQGTSNIYSLDIGLNAIGTYR